MNLTHQYRRTRAEMHEWLKRKRSPRWAEAERRFLKEHSKCAACGGDFLVHVHHILPIERYPELEFEEGNMLALCMSEQECLLRFGHGGDVSMKHWNPFSPSS